MMMDDRQFEELWASQRALYTKLTAGQITKEELQQLFQIGMD